MNLPFAFFAAIFCVPNASLLTTLLHLVSPLRLLLWWLHQEYQENSVKTIKPIKGFNFKNVYTLRSVILNTKFCNQTKYIYNCNQKKKHEVIKVGLVFFFKCLILLLILRLLLLCVLISQFLIQLIGS